MLQNPNGLLFPNLVNIGDCDLTRSTATEGENSIVPLWRIDWDSYDALKRSKHESWRRGGPGRAHVQFVPTLPEPWDSQLKDSTYVITPEYMQFIRMNAATANDLWANLRYQEVQRNGIMSDILLQPAVSYVWTAFWLLSDSRYDHESRYYTRDGLKGIYPHLMTWKFWQYQITHGQVAENAMLDKLGLLVMKLKESASFPQDASKPAPYIPADEHERVLTALRNHSELLMKTFCQPPPEPLVPLKNRAVSRSGTGQTKQGEKL
jgi:hypothetical protein